MQGIVKNWNDMERIWQYIYNDELKSASEEVRKNDFVYDSTRCCLPRHR